ncbi:MAG: FHA domain-containing protein, partial [Candidatus Nanoarchaeia archaeon]
MRFENVLKLVFLVLIVLLTVGNAVALDTKDADALMGRIDSLIADGRAAESKYSAFYYRIWDALFSPDDVGDKAMFVVYWVGILGTIFGAIWRFGKKRLTDVRWKAGRKVRSASVTVESFTEKVKRLLRISKDMAHESDKESRLYDEWDRILNDLYGELAKKETDTIGTMMGVTRDVLKNDAVVKRLHELKAHNEAEEVAVKEVLKNINALLKEILNEHPGTDEEKKRSLPAEIQKGIEEMKKNAQNSPTLKAELDNMLQLESLEIGRLDDFRMVLIEIAKQHNQLYQLCKRIQHILDAHEQGLQEESGDADDFEQRKQKVAQLQEELKSLKKFYAAKRLALGKAIKLLRRLLVEHREFQEAESSIKKIIYNAEHRVWLEPMGAVEMTQFDDVKKKYVEVKRIILNKDYDESKIPKTEGEFYTIRGASHGDMDIALHPADASLRLPSARIYRDGDKYFLDPNDSQVSTRKGHGGYIKINSTSAPVELTEGTEFHFGLDEKVPIFPFKFHNPIFIFVDDQLPMGAGNISVIVKEKTVKMTKTGVLVPKIPDDFDYSIEQGGDDEKKIVLHHPRIPAMSLMGGREKHRDVRILMSYQGADQEVFDFRITHKNDEYFLEKIHPMTKRVIQVEDNGNKVAKLKMEPGHTYELGHRLALFEFQVHDLPEGDFEPAVVKITEKEKSKMPRGSTAVLQPLGAVAVRNKDGDARYIVLNKRETIIGRRENATTEDQTILVTLKCDPEMDADISLEQFHIIEYQGHYILSNLSAGGVTVGKDIKGGKKAVENQRLEPKDIICIPGTTARFKFNIKKAKVEGDVNHYTVYLAKYAEVERDTLGVLEKVNEHIMIMRNERAVDRILLGKTELVAGRKENCDLVFTEENEEYVRAISRVHYKINMTSAGYWVEDMGSEAGTKVMTAAGTKILRLNEKHQLRHDDIIQPGDNPFGLRFRLKKV